MAVEVFHNFSLIFQNLGYFLYLYEKDIKYVPNFFKLTVEKYFIYNLLNQFSKIWVTWDSNPEQIG